MGTQEKMKVEEMPKMAQNDGGAVEDRTPVQNQENKGVYMLSYVDLNFRRLSHNMQSYIILSSKFIPVRDIPGI